MATLKNTKIDDTGYLGVPTGSNAQRPNTASAGMIRWNTSETILEVYDGTQWKLFSNEEYVKTYSVTDSTTSTNEGTTITFTTTTENVIDGTTLYYTLSGVDSNDVSTGTSGNFTINNNSGSVDVSLIEDTATEGSETLTFQVRTDSTSGTIVASDTTTINDTSVSPDIEYLLVGGGGGAGGYISNTLTLVSGTTYTITIGAGGSGGTSTSGQAGDGGNSSISASGISTITAMGGGGGGNCTGSGRDGGSGGGGSGCSFDRPGGSGTSSQGNDGGNGRWVNNSPGNGNGGGGGGAGGAGGNGASRSQGTSGGAGAGISNDITGTSITYAVGGNGGPGGPNMTRDGSVNGDNNTGNGGNGGTNRDGGMGRDGVAILRIPTSTYSGTTTGSPTVTTDGVFTVVKFTSSGTYTV